MGAWRRHSSSSRPSTVLFNVNMKHVIPLNRFGTIRYKSVSFGIKLRLTEELLIPFQSK